jgi:hypothetical protein
MKKIYAAVALVLPVLAFAQQVRTHETATNVANSHQKGVSFYSESFDADLNGWSSVTEVGVVDWKWTDVGPGTTSSTYPVPPLNTSTPSGWAIIDDDFDGASGQQTNASLISPVIDLSSAPTNLRVRFDQYFQEFQADATFVGVSTDGGTTWNEVEINDGVGREGRPNPEVVEVSITEWVAVNPANVQLRFRYESSWDYGWQVDNIAVVEQFQFDMIAVSAFLSHTGTGEEYGRIPASQLNNTMLVGGELKNDGSQEQTNVVATMEVRNPDDVVAFTATTNIGTLAANTSFFMEEFVTLPALDDALYTATLTVTSDQQASDANTANNAKVRVFEVNSGRYSLDAVGLHPAGTQLLGSLGTNSFDGGEDGLVVMTYYEVIEPLEVYGIEFLITSATVTGGFVTTSILDTADVFATVPLFTNPVVESDAYDINADNISSGVVQVLFPDVTTVQPGGYFAAVTMNSNAGAGHIRVVDDLTVPQPNVASAIFIPNDQVFSNGNALAIRLLTEPINIGVSETAASTLAHVFPNPSTGLVNIRVSGNDTQVVEVLNVAGELVHNSTVQGSSTIDLSGLAKGVYTLRVVGTNGSSAQRITLQ